MSDKKRNGDNGQVEDRARTTEIMVSLVLRTGVIVSATVIVAGIALLVAHGSAGLPGGLDGSAAFRPEFGAVLSGAARFEPVSVIALGLLLIILTPVLRVAISIVAFAREGDWKYVAITALVLGVLILSFALGKAGS